MAFFGVTLQGYQDPIREHVVDAGMTPQHVFQSGLYRDPLYRLPPIKGSLSDIVQSADPKKTLDVAPECRDRPVYSAGYAGANVSYSDLKSRIERHKYQHDPKVVYRRPIVSSQEIGDWARDEPIREKLPWTYTQRRVLVNSEMTRFVDQMGLTNRCFSLFNN